jgi:HSP20 family protein
MSKETQIAVKRPSEIRPWSLMDVDSLFDRMFGNTWLRPFPRPWLDTLSSRTLALELPLVDVYTEKDEVVVKAEIPGLTKDEIDVSVSGNTLTIKGEKKKEEETKDKDYYQCERSYGAFSRSIELPAEVKTDTVKATFKNGVLEVRLPKTEEARNNVVHVKVA